MNKILETLSRINGTRLQFVILGAVVVSFIVGSLFIESLGNKSAKPEALEYTFDDKKTQDQFSQNPLLQIQVGEKNKDLETLPGFREKRDLGDNTYLYLYTNKDLSFDNQIIARDNLVQFKSIITILPETNQTPALSAYLKNLGKAEAEIKGSSEFGPFSISYIYPSKGVAIIGNNQSNEVYATQEYIPTTTQLYIDQFRPDITSFKEESHPFEN